jgi:hypothetical protein
MYVHSVGELISIGLVFAWQVLAVCLIMTHADSVGSHDQVSPSGNILGYKLQRQWYTWVVQ